jgi:hypothetical protein
MKLQQVKVALFNRIRKMNENGGGLYARQVIRVNAPFLGRASQGGGHSL